MNAPRETKSLEKHWPDARQERDLTDAERQVLLARRQFDHELRETARATRGALGGLAAAVGVGAIILVAGWGVRALWRSRRRPQTWVVRISVEPGRPARSMLPALGEGALRLVLARLARAAVGSERHPFGGDGGLSPGRLGSNSPPRGEPADPGWSAAPTSVVQP